MIVVTCIILCGLSIIFGLIVNLKQSTKLVRVLSENGIPIPPR